MSPKTLVGALRSAADNNGDAVAYTFWQPDGSEPALSRGELDHRARAIGARLAERLAPGSRALLVYGPGLDFVQAFFGCLYAGVIAVPVYPPRPDRMVEGLASLELILADTGSEALLCDALVAAFADDIRLLSPRLADLWWLETSAIPSATGGNWVDPGVNPDTVAYLQYTSGSTGNPKGVVLRHRHLLSNQAQIRELMALGDDTVFASWLPLYHDMGLVGCVMQPLYLQIPSHLMAPTDFLAKPLRWLQLVSRHAATISGGPNFAFELCVRKVTDADLADLDLSSWQVAFCGAEPVRGDTMDRFGNRFAAAGFEKRALLPCYGLAEASLIVTGAPASTGHRPIHRGREAGGEVISVGRPATDVRVLVADPETGVAQPDGRVGEVWVRSGSVADGYWRQPEATAATFAPSVRLASDGPGRVEEPGPWLRTGDLGFLLDGELYVTGRIKDVLIVRGRNVHPHDLEAAVQAADTRFRPGCGAVFARDGETGVTLVQETIATPDELPALVAVARRAALRASGVDLEQVVLVPPRSVPKTSSGKIRRRECRELLLQGELEVLS
jgi:acyl-CoA synthetase (AMP-forming)/AMP-acid ligase II